VSLATSSGQETVATHSSTILDLGLGDTIANKVVSGQALSGIVTRYYLDLDYQVSITETCTSGGSATMALNLISSTDSALGSGNTTLDTIAATAVASLTAGKILVRGSLRGKKLDRYLGCQHVIATAALTDGTIYGGLGVGILGLNPNRATA
jgi:hypothetical protein